MAVITGDFPLNIWTENFSAGDIPLLISGSKYDAYMPLHIHSFVEETLPLFLFANYDTRTLYLQCGYKSTSDLPLFMNSSETFNTLPLYIVAGTPDPANKAIPLYIRQTTNPSGEITLHIDGKTVDPISEEMNLFLQQGASDGGKGYLSLSIEGKQITLYPDNSRSSNGYIPAFDTITLMMNREVESVDRRINMYVSGVLGVSSLSINNNMSLRVKAIEGTTSAITTLYTLGPNPLTAARAVFISGE